VPEFTASVNVVDDPEDAISHFVPVFLDGALKIIAQ
jgi:hypothetical protein